MSLAAVLKMMAPWALLVVAPITAILGYLFGTWTEAIKRQNAYRQRVNEERLKAYQALLGFIADRYAMTVSELIDQHLQILPRYVQIYPCISEADHQAVMAYIATEHQVVNRLHRAGKLDTAIATENLMAAALNTFLFYMRGRLLATEVAGETNIDVNLPDMQEFNIYTDGILDDMGGPASR